MPPLPILKILAFAMISVPWVDLRGDAGAGRALRNVLCLALLAGKIARTVGAGGQGVCGERGAGSKGGRRQ